jgi:hypothetical protein
MLEPVAILDVQMRENVPLTSMCKALYDWIYKTEGLN